MIDVKTNARILTRKKAEQTLPYVPQIEERLFYALAKRLLDILLAAILLVLFSPVMAAIAVLIRLDSPGPAIFRQKRVGQGGRNFTLYKFRSMHYGADESVHREFARRYIHGQCKANGQGCFKPESDPRVTRIGRILRMTSLDELPQLWNVLKGEMSLVGPRPAMDYEVAEYTRWQMQRLAVLPGLTGLAQISGRSGLTFERIVRLDISYVENRNLWLDLKIILLTIPVVLLAKCAG